MNKATRASASLARSPSNAVVRSIPFVGDDAALVTGLLAGRTSALSALYQRYAKHVQSILRRILGFDHELSDIEHDAFVRALSSLRQLRDPSALKPWLTSVAVFTARIWIQRRRRRRWLRFMPEEKLPEREAPVVAGEVREALHAVYAVLDELPADERIAFSMRFIEGMQIEEVAATCGVSLSTMKRRLIRAEQRFRKVAASYPVLIDWLEGGARCNRPIRG